MRPSVVRSWSQSVQEPGEHQANGGYQGGGGQALGGPGLAGMSVEDLLRQPSDGGEEEIELFEEDSESGSGSGGEEEDDDSD